MKSKGVARDGRTCSSSGCIIIAKSESGLWIDEPSSEGAAVTMLGESEAFLACFFF